MGESNYWLVYSTFGAKDEAFFVARTLLERRLIACANVMDNATSLYRWQDAIEEQSEVILFAKTTAAQVQAVIEAIKTLHSYEVPCVIAWPIVAGSLPFLQWVAGETASLPAAL